MTPKTTSDSLGKWNTTQAEMAICNVQAKCGIVRSKSLFYWIKIVKYIKLFKIRGKWYKCHMYIISLK